MQTIEIHNNLQVKLYLFTVAKQYNLVPALKR